MDGRSIYRFGPYLLDVRARLLSVDGIAVPLGPRVVETLTALVRKRGEVVSKTELLDEVWPEGFVEEANVAQNVYVLRKALRAAWDVDAIQTLPRRGYRFVAPVTVAIDAHPMENPAPQKPAFAPAVKVGVRPRMAWLAVAFLSMMLLVAFQKSLQPHAALMPSAASRLSPTDQRYNALGRYYWNQRTQAGVLRSIAYFKHVVRFDPHNPLGFSGLADAYSIMADYGYGRSSMSYRTIARRAAREAVSLDDRCAEAHASLGFVRENIDGDIPAAAAEYTHAIALNPNYATAHQWYGTLLLLRGRSEPGRRELENAVRLDPTSPAINTWLASAEYFGRDYVRSVEFAKQALELDPARRDALVVLGLAYEQEHRHAAALGAFERLARLGEPDEALALVAYTHARSGRTLIGRRELEQLLKRKEVAPQEVAVVLIALGRREAALDWLRRSNLKATQAKTWLALDPRLDPVRHDARFRRWMKLQSS
ncbi:MAG: winged helix-turn-helix domain-containing protein [Candidatus Eremiobacteraeota bacterium]|nr:winged helix-turn-helix domain-containing protein [Candidatus Eremiobacteraeota bacterium]